MAHRKKLSLVLLLLVSMLCESTALAAVAKPKLKLSIASVKVTVGFTTSVSYGMTDDSTVPLDVQLTSKDKKIATISTETGLVTGVKIGTTTLYAKSKSLGSKGTGSVKVQVVKNYKGWSNPATISVDNPEAIFILSTNKVYYKGDSFVAEVFVYNRARSRTARPSALDIPLRVVNTVTGLPMSDFATGVYTDANTSKIAFKKSGVIRVTFPKANANNAALFPKNDAGRLDLRDGIYECLGSSSIGNGSHAKALTPSVANGTGKRVAHDAM